MKENLDNLFREHIKKTETRMKDFLAKNKQKGILIDAGVPYQYFRDDHTAPFCSNPYFLYFCPLKGEKHLISLSPEGSLELYVFEPKSFWSDISYEVSGSFWSENFQVHYLFSEAAREEVLKSKSSYVFIGREFQGVDKLDFLVNPKEFLAAMDWWRAEKSPYEIHCLSEANRKASRAHLKVRDSFYSTNPSELVLYEEFLSSLKETGDLLPYNAIIAHNEKAAILHYQYKRSDSSGDVLLIDAGASYLHYASDITRTYFREKNCHPSFVSIYKGMESLQRELCGMVKEGSSFVDLQLFMHRGIAEILMTEKILLTSTPEEAFTEKLTSVFCPHGLGHMLGLQVHDVGGDQKDISGTPCDKDARLPKARMNRSLRNSEVVTIEPGLYFIPFLLQEMKESKQKSLFNWALLEELTPFGGIRIEDDMLVRAGSEPLNLTRAHLS